MNNLIVAISLALIVGRSHCQSYGSATSAQDLNGTPAGTLPTNASALTNVTYASDPNNLNGAVGTNLSLASNGASGWGATNTTSQMGNSSTSLNTSFTALGGLNSVTNTVGTNATNLGSSTTWSDTSTSSTSVNASPTVYLMNEDIHWATSNFSIYDQNGNLTYQITKQVAGMNLTEKEFVVEDASTGEKKLRIDAHVKFCGFGQTYEADDGTTFRLDPRAFLSDRWYIKSVSSDTEYVYKRGAMSVAGKIFEKERVIAQVATHVNSTFTTVSTRQMSLQSDGTIPPWNLIALMAIVKTRIHSCGY